MAIAMTLIGCQQQPAPPSPRLHAFYYPWYGTPELDGEFIHWRHDVLGDSVEFTYPGGDDIGADFYPEGGCYSSGDPAVLRRQMRQLRRARIGVICVSWLGPESFEARLLPTLMDVAAEFGILVNFHLEPAVQRTIHTIREAVTFLIDTYGEHPAFYRAPETGGLGLFYVYDSYNTSATEWARLLTPGGDLSIRGTRWDAAVVGLLLSESDTDWLEAGGFDGGYAYFAVDGFSYASTTANWTRLAEWARERNLLFIPSVGPGYSDRRIRPWNRRNQRLRDSGRYYDCLFSKAIAADPAIISITSFNEWHEGTQIEPAIPFAIDSFTYLDYLPLSPDAYLRRTARWVLKWSQYKAGAGSPDSIDEDICGGGYSRNSVTHLALGREIRLASGYSETYAAGGASALLDGITASTNYRDGCWQGFEGVDLVADIDLGEETPVPLRELRLSFLRDRAVWIFLPDEIRVEGSRDGSRYEALATVRLKIPPSATDPQRHEEVIALKGQSYRFLRIRVVAKKICPADHPGAGRPAWLFADEIQVVAQPRR